MKFVKITILASALTLPSLLFGEVTTTITNDGTNVTVSKTQPDADIVSQSNAALSKDQNLNAANINVTSQNGNVTLSGTVNNTTDYENAIAKASAVTGVNNVNADGLTVQNNTQSLKDSFLNGQIKGALIKNNFVNADGTGNISFTNSDGVIYLNGTVEHEEDKQKLVQDLIGISGVSSVNTDGVTVKSSASANMVTLNENVTAPNTNDPNKMNNQTNPNNLNNNTLTNQNSNNPNGYPSNTNNGNNLNNPTNIQDGSSNLNNQNNVNNPNGINNLNNPSNTQNVPATPDNLNNPTNANGSANGTSNQTGSNQ